jgi:hypothetical protein
MENKKSLLGEERLCSSERCKCKDEEVCRSRQTEKWNTYKKSDQTRTAL